MNQTSLDNVYPVALRVCQTLGWPSEKASVIMAQFILEKGWEYWADYPTAARGSDFNFGNAGDPMNGPLPVIASETAGILLYGFVLCLSNPSAYQAYWDAMLSGSNEEAVTALADSVWCDPPYGATLHEVYSMVMGGVGAWAGTPTSVQSSEPSSSAPSQAGSSVSESQGQSNSSLTKNQYQVRPGDTMSGIAVSRGVPLRRLLALNPQVSDPNRIVPGEIINL